MVDSFTTLKIKDEKKAIYKEQIFSELKKTTKYVPVSYDVCSQSKLNCFEKIYGTYKNQLKYVAFWRKKAINKEPIFAQIRKTFRVPRQLASEIEWFLKDLCTKTNLPTLHFLKKSNKQRTNLIHPHMTPLQCTWFYSIEIRRN